LREEEKVDGMAVRTGEGTGNKRGIIRSHPVENSLWKRLWISRKTENGMMMMMMMMMMMFDGDVF
jgi:hypothetical protein